MHVAQSFQGSRICEETHSEKTYYVWRRKLRKLSSSDNMFIGIARNFCLIMEIKIKNSIICSRALAGVSTS